MCGRKAIKGILEKRNAMMTMMIMMMTFKHVLSSSQRENIQECNENSFAHFAFIQIFHIVKALFQWKRKDEGLTVGDETNNFSIDIEREDMNIDGWHLKRGISGIFHPYLNKFPARLSYSMVSFPSLLFSFFYYFSPIHWN